MLDILAEQGVRSFETYDVEGFRGLVEAFAGLQAPKQDVTSVIDYDNNGLAVRVVVPAGAGDEPLPIIVNYHGGGWVGGSLDVVEEPGRALANATGAIVVLPEYRLAPEHKFPAGPDDAFSALKWAIAHAEEIGGDVARVGVMGDSAGATLAAATAVRARDEGIDLAFQVLEYPVIDGAENTESFVEMSEGYLLHSAAGPYLWGHYLNSPEDIKHPYASPSHADLTGLPPTLVITLEYDPTRDAAELFAVQLKESGVPTTHVRIDGLIHASGWMSGAIPRSAEILDAASRFIQAVLEPAVAGR
ncbi:alpha/beta hydrolase [Leifsonia sp. NPDC077715]|uniref:alpha/beta hydrolase n=1 Tax=Leifsonia sp. NPDC077715 TaxID=3155539 RepID=UPI00342FA25D